MRHRHHAAATAAADPPDEPPGGMTQVPRVAGGREAQRLGGHGRAHLGHVGAAQRDESGRQELLGEVGGHRPGQFPQRPEADPRGHSPATKQPRSLSSIGTPRNGPAGQPARGLARPGRTWS